MALQKEFGSDNSNGMRNILSKIVRKLSKNVYRHEDFGKIGKNCYVNPDSILVPQNIYMDDNVIIQNNVNFISNKGRLFIKKNSVISSGCTIIPGTHLPTVGVSFYQQALEHIGDEDGDIIIVEDCWIGANSILLPGCIIGRGAIVAAGAVVTKNVPPYSVVAGCPARVIATKFTKEDIIAHEEKLYSESEKLEMSYLDTLFTESFLGKKSLRKFTE